MSEKRDVAVGGRVMFVSSTDPYTRLVRGVRGTVVGIDCTGTVFVHWEDGSSLGMVIAAGDVFQTLEDENR